MERAFPFTRLSLLLACVLFCAAPQALLAQQITALDAQSCAILSDGSVRCWGLNNNAGQLGYPHSNNIGDNEIPSSQPTIAVGASLAKLIVGAPRQHICGILTDGNVRCWGLGSFGRLGYGNTNTIGDNEDPSTAGNVSVGAPVTKIVGTAGTTCALLNTGDVKCWGSGNNGETGYGNTNHIGDDELPSSVGTVSLGGTVVDLDGDTAHFCAVLSNGDVRCWGAGSFGRLGYGNANTIGDDEVPSSVGPLSLGAPAVQVGVGINHGCALLNDNTVRCWGQSEAGQGGRGDNLTIGDNELPTTVGVASLGPGTISKLAVGGDHNCVIFDDGTMKCWGKNTHGQLGYGHTNHIGDNELPSSVGTVNAGGTVIDVSLGGAHTCALLSTNEMKCWGNGTLGRLGYGNTNNLGDNGGEMPPASVSIGGTVATAAQPPSATTGTASGITTVAATLGGTVNANDGSTTVTFEYGTDTNYGSEATAAESPVSGTTDTAVSAALSGLTPGTTYHFRVKAVNAEGTTLGSDATFTTLGAAPTATTGAASSVTATAASLAATVNPNELSTTVTFEYGTDTNYGSEATAAESPLTGNTDQAVSAALTGLVPATTYHFRVKAVNSLGTTLGSDATFTTSGWQVQLGTSVGTDADNDNLAGMANGATNGFDGGVDRPEPPTPPSGTNYVRTYFTDLNNATLGDKFTHDFHAPADLSDAFQTWNLEVEAVGHDGQTVTLSRTATGLPTGYRILLLDGTAKHDLDAADFAFTYVDANGPKPLALRIGDSTNPSVSLTAPNGGQNFTPGTTQTISWTASDGSGLAAILLEYSTDGGATYTAITTLTDAGQIAAGSYDWTIPAALSSYQVRLRATATDEMLNTNSDASDADLTVLPTAATRSVTPGFGMISLPLVPVDNTVAAVLGDDASPYYVFQYEPGTNYTSPSTFAQGRGYFVAVLGNADLDVDGTAPLTSVETTLPNAGFYMLGVPFPVTLTTAHLEVVNGAETKSFADAVAALWISGTLYGFDGSSYQVATSFVPWHGYWFASLVPNLTIRYHPVAVGGSGKRDAHALPVIAGEGSWSLPLLAEHEGGSSAGTTALGMSVGAEAGWDALDALAPPRAPVEGMVRVSVPNGALGALDRDVRGVLGEGRTEEVWPLVVEGESGVVRLSWSVPESAATQYEFVLVDGSRSVDMAEVNEHALVLGSSGRRSLSVVVRLRGAGVAEAVGEVPVVFGLSSAYPNPFNPVTRLRYTLASSSEVRLEVYDLMGRRVSVLVSGGVVEAGAHEATFDARGLSSGVYMVRLVAGGEVHTRTVTLLK